MKVQRLKQLTILLIALALMFIAACSSNNESGNGDDEPSTPPANQEERSGNDASEAAVKEVEPPPDPFGKYETSIEFSTIRKEVENIKFPPGITPEKNVWTEHFESELGIKLTYDWTVHSNQWDQKLNVSIVSDDLPDFYRVNARQMQILIEGDKLADLTDVFDQYASPLLKEAYNEADIFLDSSTFQGKLMGLAKKGSGGSVDGSPMLWIRTDWLENLGLPEPETAQDVFKIIEAFTKDDPDQNGMNDTYGLNLNMDLYSGYSGLDGFFNMFHSYAYIGKDASMMWVEDDQGNLKYGSIQPETKQALTKLSEFYEMGAIDTEWGNYDTGKSAENEMSGKTGLHFGTFSNTGWPLRQFKVQNPEGEWKPFPIPSIDNQPARPMVTSAAPTEFYVVNAKSEHPEAMIKLANFYYEKVVGPNAVLDKFHTVVVEDEPFTVFGLSPIVGGMTETNQNDHYKVVEALKSGDASDLSAGQQSIYDAIQKYREEKDLSFWFRETQFGEEGGFSVLGYYKQNGLPLRNAYYGTPTQTMAELGSSLRDLEVTTFTKIIMEGSVDEFDQYVEDWKSLGGDQITKEVNEWYSYFNE